MTRYISNGTWFIDGTEATLIDDYRPQINSGLFRGQRRSEGPPELHPIGEIYEDEEVCGFDEFEVRGMKDYESIISSDVLVVPKDGILVLTMPPETSDKVMADMQDRVAKFFKGRRALVIRSGDVKIGYILWKE